MFRDTLALRLLGWQAAAATDELSRLIGDAISPADAAGCLQALEADDVTALLDQVRVPTLILGRVPGYIGAEPPRLLAQAIPGARLAFAEGSAIAPQLRDSAEVCTAIERFLGELAG